MAEHETAAQVLAAERTAVLRRLVRLELELSGIIESGSAGSDDEHDPEGATLAFERQHAAALLSRARQHLADIEAAILRLAECEYGDCAACGEAIGAARLAARPAATTCIRCASLAQRRLRRSGLGNPPGQLSGQHRFGAQSPDDPPISIKTRQHASGTLRQRRRSRRDRCPAFGVV